MNFGVTARDDGVLLPIRRIYHKVNNGSVASDHGTSMVKAETV